ncbi:MAG: phosphopentomutase [Armatimonadetes bacterium]|nr:phosphopentomutase [Armatimonadota bacterium]
MSRRAIVIVLDGCGAGAAPDCAEFGDPPTVSTLKNVWNLVGGIEAPNLAQTGFLAAAGIGKQTGAAGRLRPLNRGKDSVTGHWEMMGIPVPTPFPTYPSGFPANLISAFESAVGRKILGNRPASGTAIVDELGEEHYRTGRPIVYTSADSVFQIAAHESIVPIGTLYEWCQIARDLCVPPNNVQRVIARPFNGEPGRFQRTNNRKDFPVIPPPNLLDRLADRFGPACGIGVVPELFSGRGFRPGRRTQSNPEHWLALQQALDADCQFVFANFEDTDMLFGHRSDPAGFANCLEQFDGYLGALLARLSADDLLILTADHGNDPTDGSTDHTREYSPLAVVNSQFTQWLGDQDGLATVGRLVEGWLE